MNIQFMICVVGILLARESIAQQVAPPEPVVEGGVIRVSQETIDAMVVRVPQETIDAMVVRVPQEVIDAMVISTTAAGQRSLTVSGPDCYFGGTAREVAENCWFVDGAFGFAIAMALSDSRVEIHGASGITSIEIEGLSLDEAIAAIADGSGDATPTVICDASQHLCHCGVSVAQSCTGAVINSYRCCSITEACSCITVNGPSSTCIAGVKVKCLSITPSVP